VLDKAFPRFPSGSLVQTISLVFIKTFIYKRCKSFFLMKETKPSRKSQNLTSGKIDDGHHSSTQIDYPARETSPSRGSLAADISAPKAQNRASRSDYRRNGAAARPNTSTI
jgi:hypothetical protein